MIIEASELEDIFKLACLGDHQCLGVCAQRSFFIGTAEKNQEQHVNPDEILRVLNN
jgi:hypothetical protein